MINKFMTFALAVLFLMLSSTAAVNLRSTSQRDLLVDDADNGPLEEEEAGRSLTMEERIECTEDSQCASNGLECGFGRCRRPAGGFCLVEWDCASRLCDVHGLTKSCVASPPSGCFLDGQTFQEGVRRLESSHCAAGNVQVSIIAECMGTEWIMTDERRRACDICNTDGNTGRTRCQFNQ